MPLTAARSGVSRTLPDASVARSAATPQVEEAICKQKITLDNYSVTIASSDNVVDDRNKTGLRERVRQRADIPSAQLKLRPSFVLGRALGRNESVDDELFAYEIAFDMRRP
jgi:hypothetical protein